MKFLFLHDSAESEIGNHNVRILSFRAEKEIFGFQVWQSVR